MQILFKTGNFHYIPLNSENETRFTLNFRFKNLFSVYGSKVYPEYFKIVKSSKNSAVFVSATPLSIVRVSLRIKSSE